MTTKNTASSKQKSLATIVALVALFVIAAAGIASLGFRKKNNPSGSAITILPVPAPKEGERLRDIPTAEVQKRNDFLKAGATQFGIKPTAAPDQTVVANACAYDAAAQIAHDARSVKSYRENPNKIKADIKAVNQNCHAKYADKDYEAPPQPQSHINRQTFGHH
jgi:hypothetical protein